MRSEQENLGQVCASTTWSEQKEKMKPPYTSRVERKCFVGFDSPNTHWHVKC